MANVSLTGSASLAAAQAKAKAAGVGAYAATQWWNMYGQQQASSRVSQQRTLSSLQDAQASAQKANEQRYKEAKGKMEMIEGIYAPGGSFAKGYAAFLAGQKEQSVAAGSQKLVGSGLYNTTEAAGLEHVWDTKVGAPAMANFQRMQMGEYAKALQGTAGLIERREDIGPDYGMIAQLMMKANA